MASGAGGEVRVVELREAAGSDEFGCKAAYLAILAAAGLPVPEAFCVSARAYRDMLSEIDAAGMVGRITTLTADKPSVTVTTLLQRLRSAIVNTPFDPGLAEALDDALSRLGTGPVSVRSSLTTDCHDPGTFSPNHGTYFASDRDVALREVRHCWASLWTDWEWRRRDPAGDAGEPAVGVIVQRLVEADASGVVFTADPSTGDRDRVVVQSCLGLGEAIVSAKVDPDRHVLDRDGLRVVGEHLGGKTRRLGVDEEGCVREVGVDPVRAWQPAVGPEMLVRLARLALQVEAVLGEPVAVEFAVSGDDAWLLQGRPIVFAR